MSAFPAGTMPNAALVPADRLSWQAAILPFLEQQALYTRLDRNVAWNVGANVEPGRTPLRVLQCPAWAATDGNGWMTTYIGVAGVGADAATLPSNDPRAGVFGYDRRTRMLSDIPDGLSNTLLVMESVRDVGPWAQGGAATVRGFDPVDRPYLGNGYAFGSNHFPNKTWFSHDRDIPATAALADGSTRLWYPSRTSPEVLEAWSTTAGGETVPAD